MRKLVVSTTVLLLAGLVAWPVARYRAADRETEVLDATARLQGGGSYARLSHGLTHYEVMGASGQPAVVFVNGFSVPYYLWDPTIRPVADAGFEAVRYDLYGRGYSDRPDVVYDAELFDEQLHELIGKLGLQKPVTLVACSLGGPIAATYTARHPEEVRSLVLIAPGYAGSQPMPPAIRAPLYGEYTMATAIAPRLGAGQAADLLHPEQHPEYVSRFEQQMRYPGFRRAILSTLRNFLVRDNRPDFRRVGELGKPVLLIWGRHDRDVPFAVSGEVRTAIPQAEFLPVEDAAHVPHIEHPEIVNPAIAAFLRKTTR